MMLIGGSVVIVAVTDLMTEGDSISIFFAVFGVAFFNGALFLYGKLLGSMKKAMKRVGIVAGILAVLFLFAATGEPTEPLEKEEAVNELSSFSGVFFLAAVALFGYGIVKGKAMFMLASPMVAGAYFLMYWGVINDKPYFIRKIPGTDFVGIWFIYVTSPGFTQVGICSQLC